MGDCNDDPNAGGFAIKPGALEICDSIDNNCNGIIDEGSDKDGDGEKDCEACPQIALANCDCNDKNALVNHNMSEDCTDGIDNNCDNIIDDNVEDGDLDGWTLCDGDCDDFDIYRSPGQPERCNGIDDNCDGVTDEHYDNDNDWFKSCTGDCDDTRNYVFPMAPELCDGLDNDCDKDFSGEDDDNDGYFNSDCGGDDCSDTNSLVFPSAIEDCYDGIDNNCDTLVDFDETEVCIIETPVPTEPKTEADSVVTAWFCNTSRHRPPIPALLVPLLVLFALRRRQPKAAKLVG
jgi:hypothetical protein